VYDCGCLDLKCCLGVGGRTQLSVDDPLAGLRRFMGFATCIVRKAASPSMRKCNNDSDKRAGAGGSGVKAWERRDISLTVLATAGTNLPVETSPERCAKTTTGTP